MTRQRTKPPTQPGRRTRRPQLPDRGAQARRPPTYGVDFVDQDRRSLLLQAKLTINRPGDRFEWEADRVADLVMRMSHDQVDTGERLQPDVGLALQRSCTRCAKERQPESADEPEDEAIARSHAAVGPVRVSPQLSAQIQTLRGGGRPLSPSEREFFEPRFGADFSEVRVHTGQAADTTARAVNARAFTLGRDIVFRAGEYEGRSHEGRRLMAHELTHVLQQRASQPSPIRSQGATFQTTSDAAALGSVIQRGLDEEMARRVQRRQRYYNRIDPSGENLLVDGPYAVRPVFRSCYQDFLESLRLELIRYMVSENARDQAFSRQILNTPNTLRAYCTIRESTAPRHRTSLQLTFLRVPDNRWIRFVRIVFQEHVFAEDTVTASVVSQADAETRRVAERVILARMYRAFGREIIRDLPSDSHAPTTLTSALIFYANAMICLANRGRPTRGIHVGTMSPPAWLQRAREDWSSLVVEESAATQQPDRPRSPRRPPSAEHSTTPAPGCDQPEIEAVCDLIARQQHGAAQEPAEALTRQQANLGHGNELLPYYREWAAGIVRSAGLPSGSRDVALETLRRGLDGGCVTE